LHLSDESRSPQPGDYVVPGTEGLGGKPTKSGDDEVEHALKSTLAWQRIFSDPSIHACEIGD
jgi:hypothetical protein